MEVRHTFDDLDKISFEGFGVLVSEAGRKLIDILSEVKLEVLSKESFIRQNQLTNFIRVKIHSVDDRRLPFQIDIFDSYYDIFIDNGIEYDLQAKLEPIDEWVEKVKQLLKAQVILKFKESKKGNRMSAKYIFYDDNKKITHVGYWSIKALLIKTKKEATFEPWLE